MYPHIDECPDIPYNLLTPKHLCYDLLYNPDITLFMKKAAEHGAEVKTGLKCCCSRHSPRGTSGMNKIRHLFV